MIVEPLLSYRRPKYPRKGEGVQPRLPLAKNKALLAAMLVVSASALPDLWALWCRTIYPKRI